MPEIFHPYASFGHQSRMPMRFEADVFECHVEGEIPLDRTGSYGYTVRALPSNDLLASHAELGVVAVA